MPKAWGVVAGGAGLGLVAGLLIGTGGGSSPANPFETALTQGAGDILQPPVHGKAQANAMAGVVIIKVAHPDSRIVIAEWQTAYAHAGSPNEDPPSPEVGAAEVCATAEASGSLGDKARFDYIDGLAKSNGNHLASDRTPEQLFNEAARLCTAAALHDVARGHVMSIPVSGQ